MFYRTVGEVIVKRRFSEDALPGDTFFDDDTGAFYIFYGDGVGWLRVSREDLMSQDGC